MKRETFDLNARLVDFACLIIEVSEALPSSVAGSHLASQLIRSGTAPALQYGEAQGGESRNDFIHKMKVALKELRESYNCLKIILKLNWHQADKMKFILDENNQLISIFVTSVLTAQRNTEAEKSLTREKRKQSPT